MTKKNNPEYPLIEVPPRRPHNHDSKFSFFIIKDVLKSKADQGIVSPSERVIPQPPAGMFPGRDMDRGGPARQRYRSNLIEIKTLSFILGVLVYRHTGAGRDGRP